MDNNFENSTPKVPFKFREIIQYNGENFVEITDKEIPGIHEKFYYININGDVYSKHLNGLMSIGFNAYGYYTVSLKDKNNVAKSRRIHRLLMLIFNYIPGCENLVINHLDGIKTNNDIYHNLEWTTNPLNTKHAAEHGLMRSGEDHGMSVLSNEQVHEICQKLSIDPHQSISALSREYNVTMETVRQIAAGIGWKQIRSQYDIDYTLNYGRLTPEQVETMCQIFVKNNGKPFAYSYLEVLKILGLEDLPNNRKRILRIFNKEPKNYPYITSKYNWDNIK